MRRPLLLLLSLLLVSGCDRFRNPKYDKNPWGQPDPEPSTTAGPAGDEQPAPSGGVLVVPTGSSNSATPAKDVTCGGVTYNDATCDTCIRDRCCDEAIACANDTTCNSLDSCRDACTQEDEACVDRCESLYYASSSAERLDACRSTECATSCD